MIVECSKVIIVFNRVECVVFYSYIGDDLSGYENEIVFV